jgi:hypothetical protein
MSFYDLNDAPEQRPDGVIPDGTYGQLRMTLRQGGENIPGSSELDLGLFKASLTSDAMYLDAEFEVLAGPHASRKFWQIFTVHGGKVGEDGVSKAWNISKATLRAMVDSALGLDPKDMSDAAKAKRALRGFRDLSGIEFFAKVGVEHGGPTPDGGTYPDKNRLAHVVVPGEPQYALLKAGKEVAPVPSATKGDGSARTAATAQPKPAWQQDAPAAAQPAATTQGPAWLTGQKKPAQRE